MKYKVLRYLKENHDFISGQKISEGLGVTRASIWKYINALKEKGYVIESISRKGYRLIDVPNVLTYEEIKDYLDTQYMGNDIINFSTIDSTNSYMKGIAFSKDEGTIITSEEQTSGRGRIGRNWTSPLSKGIYMSILLKPNLDPTKVAKLTLIGAAAVYKALKCIGIESQIKWPNDIVIGSKKVCGILTEMDCELNRIDYIVMGIGINANLDEVDIPDEISNKATSLKIIIGEKINRQQLLALVLNYFENLYDDFKENGDITQVIKICREHSALIGKEVQIIQNEDTRIGRVIDINKDGELVVEFDEGVENIISGEVSVRGLNNYI